LGGENEDVRSTELTCSNGGGEKAWAYWRSFKQEKTRTGGEEKARGKTEWLNFAKKKQEGICRREKGG